MTSLPISIPPGFSVLVKKGQRVSAGESLARSSTPEDSASEEYTQTDDDNESVIDLVALYQAPVGKVTRYLQKSPGDTVLPGDILAEKKGTFGISSDKIIAQVQGIVLRFERETGRLIIRLTEPQKTPSSVKPLPVHEITSPLAGVVTLCHNDEIVIESESHDLVGTRGVGGKAQGELLVMLNDEHEPVESVGISKDCKDKILLVHGMTRDALAKSAVIGVAGVIGTSIVQEDLDYVAHRRIGIPVIDVEEEVAKQLMKHKKQHIVMDGNERTIVAGNS